LYPKIHYRIHKYTPTVFILSQLNAVHTPTSYFQMNYLNIILPFMPGSPKWCPSGLPTKTPSPLSTNPYALHALPISFPLLSPERQCVSSTDHSAPHYGPQFYVSYVFIVTHRLSLGSTTLVVGFAHSSTFCGLPCTHALWWPTL